MVGYGINFSVDEKKEENCLSAYPLDLPYLLQEEGGRLDADGVPYQADGKSYHPGTIACYGLACWNYYLISNDNRWRDAFLCQARWLVEHEVPITGNCSGWPVSTPHPDMPTRGSWLSALVQGNAISVLVRAYELTREEPFLAVARRAVRTFERDILDGGVCSPVGEHGIFFEEVAIYPAAHHLHGCMQSLCGLYDYLTLTGDEQIGRLIEQSLETLHRLLHEFDTGYWTHPDLLSRKLSTQTQLASQITLLELLADYSGCEHCRLLARRWQGYQCHPLFRWRYWLTRNLCHWRDRAFHHMQKKLFPSISPASTAYLSVCIPVNAFPVPGGMRTVITNIAQVTEDSWKIEYLTQHVGLNREQFNIHRFGTRKATPWQFPAAWLYVLAGCIKLIRLWRSGKQYQLILPQDGVYTSAFASLVAKLAGIRCVCIDHGNLTLLNSRTFRTERIKALEEKLCFRYLLARLQYVFYWPSLSLFAWLGARFVDHYFVPGLSGDGVENVCRRLGVAESRLTRFANMIDIGRYTSLDKAGKSTQRQRYGIAADAVVIAIVCRLAPEKGLEVTLDALSYAIAALLPQSVMPLKVIVAGDGILRAQIEAEVRARGLSEIFLFYGEASKEEVSELLSISDIFLFTSWRAAGFPLTVMEAMASGCAVIAATESLANRRMLAEGRGVVFPPGETEMIGKVLVRLVNDPALRACMGSLARAYIEKHYSPVIFRRALLRVSYWSDLDALLGKKTGIAVDGVKEEGGNNDTSR